MLTNSEGTSHPALPCMLKQAFGGGHPARRGDDMLVEVDLNSIVADMQDGGGGSGTAGGGGGARGAGHLPIRFDVMVSGCVVWFGMGRSGVVWSDIYWGVGSVSRAGHMLCLIRVDFVMRRLF